MKSKILRVAAIFAACAIVFFTLIWAVSDQDSAYTCGSWWYGFILLPLILSH